MSNNKYLQDSSPWRALGERLSELWRQFGGEDHPHIRLSRVFRHLIQVLPLYGEKYRVVGGVVLGENRGELALIAAEGLLLNQVERLDEALGKRRKEPWDRKDSPDEESFKILCNDLFQECFHGESPLAIFPFRSLKGGVIFILSEESGDAWEVTNAFQSIPPPALLLVDQVLNRIENLLGSTSPNEVSREKGVSSPPKEESTEVASLEIEKRESLLPSTNCVDAKEDTLLLASLYTLSHELSKAFTLNEIGTVFITFLRSQFALQGAWFGTVSDQGNLIQGHAAWGKELRPGSHLAQLELSELPSEMVLSEELHNNARQRYEKTANELRIIERRIGLTRFLAVPLESFEQLIGVLFVSPREESLLHERDFARVLRRFASEATLAILSRRFEQKLLNRAQDRTTSILAAGVAHNFGNIFQSLLTNISVVKQETLKGSRTHARLDSMVRSAHRGAEIVRQLVALSLRGHSEQQVSSVQQLLLEMKEEIDTSLGGEGILQLDFTALHENLTTPHQSNRVNDLVRIDKTQFQQIVRELIKNSFEALQGRVGGGITVTLRKLVVRPNENQYDLMPGQYVQMDIEDDGRGMDERVLRRCFEPFFTSHKDDEDSGLSSEGRGLGLSLAAALVRRQGGVIDIRSVPESGTVVSLFFPSYESSSAVEGASKFGEPGAPAATYPEAFLLDLDGVFRGAVWETLESLGFQVAALESTAQIERALRKRSATKKVILIDLDALNDIEGDITDIGSWSKEALFIGVTEDVPYWNTVFAPFPSVILSAKPLGVWAIHTILRSQLALRAGTSVPLEEKQVDTDTQSKSRRPPLEH